MTSKPFFGFVVVVAWGAVVGFGWTADQVLVEAESFADHGGWVLDTQFITTMGSPYLLAHGLGRPVQDAVTQVAFPSAGTYRVFVRTKDWVAPWKAPDSRADSRCSSTVRRWRRRSGPRGRMVLAGRRNGGDPGHGRAARAARSDRFRRPL